MDHEVEGVAGAVLLAATHPPHEPDVVTGTLGRVEDLLGLLLGVGVDPTELG